MELYTVKLTQRVKRTKEVESFRFTSSAKINFLPGQFTQVFFDTGNLRNKELNKFLSFSCSPLKEYIEVTKKLSSSSFSQRLKNLRIGDEVGLAAPLGNCIFKDEYKKIAFLIGGIGITPVISILEYIMDKGLLTDTVLFYSNRTEDDIAFRIQLDTWQQANSNIKIFYTVTECPSSDPSCIFGRIDRDLVASGLRDYSERKIFIYGPPGMVKALESSCLEIGCRPANVKIENFIGY